MLVPILWFFLLLAILAVITFVVRLAMHPIATLVGTIRLLSFLFAAIMWIIFFVTSSGGDIVWELLILAVPATLIWLGTFAFNR